MSGAGVILFVILLVLIGLLGLSYLIACIVAFKSREV